MPSTLQTNPLAAIMRSGSPGGAPGAAPPGAPSGGGGGLQQMLGGLLSQQQGADPQFMLKQLTTVRQMLAEMIPKAMVSVEGVAPDLGGMLKNFDRVIDKLKKAAMASSLARPPIGFGAAGGGQQQSGGGSMGLFPSGGMPQSGP